MEVFSVPALVALACAALFSNCQAGGIDMNADGTGITAKEQPAKDVVFKIKGCAQETATCQNTDMFEGQITYWKLLTGVGQNDAEKKQLWAKVWVHVKKVTTKGLPDLSENWHVDGIDWDKFLNPTVAAASLPNSGKTTPPEVKKLMAMIYFKVDKGILICGKYSDALSEQAGNGWTPENAKRVDWTWTGDLPGTGVKHTTMRAFLNKLDDKIAEKLNALWKNG